MAQTIDYFTIDGSSLAYQVAVANSIGKMANKNGPELGNLLKKADTGLCNCSF